MIEYNGNERCWRTWRTLKHILCACKRQWRNMQRIWILHGPFLELSTHCISPITTQFGREHNPEAVVGSKLDDLLTCNLWKLLSLKTLLTWSEDELRYWRLWEYKAVWKSICYLWFFLEICKGTCMSRRWELGLLIINWTFWYRSITNFYILFPFKRAFCFESFLKFLGLQSVLCSKCSSPYLPFSQVMCTMGILKSCLQFVEMSML